MNGPILSANLDILLVSLQGNFYFPFIRRHNTYERLYSTTSYNRSGNFWLQLICLFIRLPSTIEKWWEFELKRTFSVDPSFPLVLQAYFLKRSRIRVAVANGSQVRFSVRFRVTRRFGVWSGVEVRNWVSVGNWGGTIGTGGCVIIPECWQHLWLLVETKQCLPEQHLLWLKLLKQQWYP